MVINGVSLKAKLINIWGERINRSINIEAIFDLDFLFHIIVFLIISYLFARALRNTAFIIKLTIIFSLVIIPGIIYEIYQGIVRDWDYDLIANSIGILAGIYIAERKTKNHGKALSPKIKNRVDEYLRTSIGNRLKIKKRSW